MAGKKRKKDQKNSITDEEKLLIRDIKSQLKTMGIPRELWARICQEELTKRRSTNKGSKKPKFSSALGKAVEKVTNQIAGSATKILSLDKMDIIDE